MVAIVGLVCASGLGIRGLKAPGRLSKEGSFDENLVGSIVHFFLGLKTGNMSLYLSIAINLREWFAHNQARISCFPYFVEKLFGIDF